MDLQDVFPKQSRVSMEAAIKKGQNETDGRVIRWLRS